MPFDADTFMQTTVDQPLAFERTLVPPGEYKLWIDDFDSSICESFNFEYKQGPRAGQPGMMVKATFPIIVDDDKVRALFGADKVRVYYECTLDFDESTGQLLFGPNKNVALGALRHAVGQNQPGPWNILQLRNAGPFMGNIEHRDVKRKDGSKFKRAEVTRMMPIR